MNEDAFTRYRTFFRRFMAGVVDSLVLLPFSILDRYMTHVDRGLTVLLLWSVVSFSIYWIYNVFLHARYGKTVGKMVMGVIVLDVSESRLPTLKQAFLRDIGYIVLNASGFVYYIWFWVQFFSEAQTEISTVPSQILSWGALAWFLIEVISMLTNEKRRALHDFIAGTVVVRSR